MLFWKDPEYEATYFAAQCEVAYYIALPLSLLYLPFSLLSRLPPPPNFSIVSLPKALLPRGPCQNLHLITDKLHYYVLERYLENGMKNHYLSTQ